MMLTDFHEIKKGKKVLYQGFYVTSYLFQYFASIGISVVISESIQDLIEEKQKLLEASIFEKLQENTKMKLAEKECHVSKDYFYLNNICKNKTKTIKI